ARCAKDWSHVYRGGVLVFAHMPAPTSCGSSPVVSASTAMGVSTPYQGSSHWNTIRRSIGPSPSYVTRFVGSGSAPVPKFMHPSVETRAVSTSGQSVGANADVLHEPTCAPSPGDRRELLPAEV